MGEMLFIRAAHAKEAWSGNSITMSQTISTRPTAPSPPIKITAVGDSWDNITQTKTTDSSNTTTELLKADNEDCLEETNVKEPPPQLNTEPDTQQHDVVSSESRAQISPEPVALQSPSPLLRLPLELRLQIYRWVLLLGTIDRKPEAGSSSSEAAKPANDAASSVSVSSTLFHCMPPYFFDSPQDFGPGDGIMFMSMFASNAHQRPLFFRKVLMPTQDNGKKKEKTDYAQLLPAYRPVGRALPLGVMSSCRQVYQEARTIAFKTSEFVFVRLFCSGLSTAHAFVVLGSQTYPGTVGGDIPRLQLWQRDSLRHVRLELDVSVADMGWTGPERDPKYLTAGENQEVKKEGPKIIDGPKWLAFCDALAKSLHGMRVLLNITEERHQGMAEDAGEKEDDTKEEYISEEYAMAARSIVAQGFTRLAALRQLEIELVWVLRGRFRSRAANMTPASTRNNLMWCTAVETAINEARRKRSETESPESSTLRPVSTKVICVERIYDEEKKKEGL
ncbi:hypothetical protein Sste5346_002800 [Sporothrix stenoceras]|uniref:Uncharacterized protein n=1 Tax=Sporothrix stenoceras TaxID=5173 RepID=A0ABR3ZHP5_9PEZI